MDSDQPRPPAPRTTRHAAAPASGRRLAIVVTVIGGLMVAAGVAVETVPLHHGTIPQWNGLCTSDVGQIGQFLDSSIHQGCGAVSVADHLIGWLFGGGILLLAAGLAWASRRWRLTARSQA